VFANPFFKNPTAGTGNKLTIIEDKINIDTKENHQYVGTVQSNKSRFIKYQKETDQ
jgi:hypothetical protein